MTNTKANLALRIAQAANTALENRLVDFDRGEALDWADVEAALRFKEWLSSITFWASADGSEVHGMGSAYASWTFTPVEIVDNVLSSFWVQLDNAELDPEWGEPAPAHHVLKLW
jgi:hypothetical protein